MEDGGDRKGRGKERGNNFEQDVISSDIADFTCGENIGMLSDASCEVYIDRNSKRIRTKDDIRKCIDDPGTQMSYVKSYDNDMFAHNNSSVEQFFHVGVIKEVQSVKFLKRLLQTVGFLRKEEGHNILVLAYVMEYDKKI